jgi:hypothetical protein
VILKVWLMVQSPALSIIRLRPNPLTANGAKVKFSTVRDSRHSIKKPPGFDKILQA